MDYNNAMQPKHSLDLTQAAIVPYADPETAVTAVFECLPAQMQTQRAIQDLHNCFLNNPFDFAEIAKRHNVPPIQVHQHNHSQHLTHSFNPQFTPHIEVKPVIHIDAQSIASAYARNESRDNPVGILIAVLGAICFGLLITGR